MENVQTAAERHQVMFAAQGAANTQKMYLYWQRLQSGALFVKIALKESGRATPWHKPPFTWEPVRTPYKQV